MKSNKNFIYFFVVLMFLIILVLVIFSLEKLNSYKEEVKTLKSELNNKEEIINEYKNKLNNCCKDSNNKITVEQLFEISKKYINKEVPNSISKKMLSRILYYDDIDPLFLTSIVIVESSFHPFAKSNKNAVGCMQVIPKIWNAELKKAGIIKEYRDYFDPEKCIDAGVYILKKYYSETNNWKKTLFRYVGGSRKYVNKVYMVYGDLNLSLSNNNGGIKNEKKD